MDRRHLLMALVSGAGVVGMAGMEAWAQPQAAGQRGEGGGGRERRGRGKGQRYSLEQALSDPAQLHTMAFSGLAFLTGTFESDTFLPPGKVSDYFGFQYLRDVDQAEGGHRQDFLTRVAYFVLNHLRPAQRELLVRQAQAHEAPARAFALARLPLMKAFRHHLADGRALDAAAVKAHSAKLYELDGQIALERARVMARVLLDMDTPQQQAWAPLRHGDSSTWPETPEPPDRRNWRHEQDVLVMTLASEMFAWHKGSLEADVYFCPERHGMYFGAFGLKTAPALGRQDYAISTALTGDVGTDFLSTLEGGQAQPLREVLEAQRPWLQEIVQLRRQVAMQLRRELAGQESAAQDVRQASARYGELDGQLSMAYAQAFAQVARSLSPGQWARLREIRRLATPVQAPAGPFLYADPLPRQDWPSAAAVAALMKAS